MTEPRAYPNPDAVRRQNELFDLYNGWMGDGDPDDDPEFVAAAREIMGLAPLADPVVVMDPTTRDRDLRMRGIVTEDRAAGHDVTPGHDELHHYWTKGEGLAKWAKSEHPWTTLVAHLTKHVGPEKAKVFASRWFHEVFGFYAGSDLNRVTHGKPPRGHVVGPG